VNDETINALERAALLAILTELAGGACRCGSAKKPRQAFCKSCYQRLPRLRRVALYKRVGEGYEQAYAAACEYLDLGAPSKTPDRLLSNSSMFSTVENSPKRGPS
jgi:hypothetical protein